MIVGQMSGLDKMGYEIFLLLSGLCYLIYAFFYAMMASQQPNGTARVSARPVQGKPQRSQWRAFLMSMTGIGLVAAFAGFTSVAFGMRVGWNGSETIFGLYCLGFGLLSIPLFQSVFSPFGSFRGGIRLIWLMYLGIVAAVGMTWLQFSLLGYVERHAGSFPAEYLAPMYELVPVVAHLGVGWLGYLMLGRAPNDDAPANP